MNEQEAERRVLALAAHVVHTDDADLPAVLLGIQDVLDACALGSRAAKLARRQVFECQLASMCVDAMGLDFERCRGGWTSAGQLPLLLVNCCMDAGLQGDEEFEQRLLPAAVQMFLSLLQRIQQRYMTVRQDAAAAVTAARSHGGDTHGPGRGDPTAERKSLQRALVHVGDALAALCNWKQTLTSAAVASGKWLAILSFASPSVGVIALNTLLRIIHVASAQQLERAGTEHWCSLLDILVLQIIAGSVDVVGEDAISLDIHSSMESVASHAAVSHQRGRQPSTSVRGSKKRRVQLACSIVSRLLSAGAVSTETLGRRYYAAHDRVSQWIGWGFDDVLGVLLKTLRRASARVKRAQQKEEAATRIQSRWRAHKQQQNWQKTCAAALLLQRWWRTTKQRRTIKTSEAKRSFATTYRSSLSRKRSSVHRHKAKASTLGVVNTDGVGQFLAVQAALTLQRCWRGRQCRLRLDHERSDAAELKRQRAAQRIQRTYRAYRSRRQRNRDLVRADRAKSSHAPSVRVHDLIADIPDARRMELQHEITRYRQAHAGAAFTTGDDLQKLHDDTQSAWHRYSTVTAVQCERLLERIKLLRTRTVTDLDTLGSASTRTLSSALDGDSSGITIATFTSHSAAVQSVARRKHEDMLRVAKLRWWEHPVTSADDWPV
eukprot:scpid34083/ scgid11661/ IQ calmodulin-binding motif-containing protein 1